MGRPALTERDRVLFKLLASKLRSWRQALAIVQPDTVLRWHRELFRCVRRHKSRRKRMRGRSPLTEDVVRLIKRIAKENHTWRAERINGELLNLGVRVAKSTIQKYSQVARGPRSPKQSWSTFLWNQAR